MTKDEEAVLLNDKRALEIDNAYLADDNHRLRQGLGLRNLVITGLSIFCAVVMYSCHQNQQDKDRLFGPTIKETPVSQPLTEIEKNNKEIDDSRRCRELGLDPKEYFRLKREYKMRSERK